MLHFRDAATDATDRKDDPAPRKPASPRTGTMLPTILASLALVVAVAALALPLARGPLGRGLSAYDFSTPEAALRSQMQIRENGDIKAVIELSKIEEGAKSDSLKVEKVVDFGVKKIVFYSYTRKGKTVQSIDGFVKDDTGIWLREYVSSVEVRRKDKKLAKEMEEWDKRPDLDLD